MLLKSEGLCGIVVKDYLLHIVELWLTDTTYSVDISLEESVSRGHVWRSAILQ